MFARFTSLTALVACLALPAAARANSIVMSDVSSGDFATNAPGGGGPFWATTDTLGSFVTFCIEFNEHISYGDNYTFTLSDGAKSGGVSGQTSPNYDPISDATKWIYTEVRTGGYTSFAPYFGAGAGVGARVQEAIWFLEGERTSGEISSGSLALANFALVQDWGLLAAAGNVVKAMNIVTAAGGPVQDQLAWTQTVRTSDTPVPEPASMILLGTGLVGAYARRRKQAGRS